MDEPIDENRNLEWERDNEYMIDSQDPGISPDIEELEPGPPTEVCVDTTELF